MKKYCLASFLLLYSIMLISQDRKVSLGVSGGTTFSGIKVENYLFGHYSFSVGFAGELSCKVNFNSHFFIMIDLGILQRGYSYYYETPIITINGQMENSYQGLEWKIDHYYLNNDWLIGYQFGNKITLSICGGVFNSYYLSSRVSERDYLYIDPVDHDILGDPALPIGYSENENITKGRNQDVSDWDLGIVGSISLGYKISDKYSIQISAKYHHGLHDISDMKLWEEVSIYNRSIVTSVGINVRI